MYSTLCNLLTLAFLLVQCPNSSDGGRLSGAGDFQIKNGDVTITGTLFLPDTGGDEFPLIIVVPGSANDGTRADLKPFADIITPQGFAMFTYDKRGTGESTGAPVFVSAENSETTIRTRASDVTAILNFFKNHENINNSKMGFLGSSQGAWVNSAVTEMSTDVAFIINAVGGASSVGVSDYYDGLTDNPNLSITDAINMIPNFNGTSGFDPAPILANLSIPVLFILGELDRSHPTQYDVQVVNNLNKSNFQVNVIPNSNHDLIDVSTGAFNPNLFPNMFQWLNANAR